MLLALAVPVAARGAAFAWSGEAAKGSSGWSQDANWQGGLVPSRRGPVTLEFPRLTSASWTSSPSTDACYASYDDVSGLEVEALDIDDGAGYTIAGGPIDLGAGGLSAAVAEGSTGAADDIFYAPIALDAPQTWTVAQPPGHGSREHGVAIEEGITGGDNALTVDLEHGSALYLFGGVETGSLAFDGTGSGSEGVVVYKGSLDSSGEGPVDVTGALLEGDGPTGPIEARKAKLFPLPRIEAASVTLEPESELVFELDGTQPGYSYSQLDASGAIDLAGAKISVVAGGGRSCYEPNKGTVFTLVTTTGPLTGSFDTSGSEEDVPIEPSEGECSKQSLQLAYHESGGTETVTGTVIDGNPTVPAAENIVTPYEIEVPPYTPPVYIKREAEWPEREAAARQREVDAAKAMRRAQERKEAKQGARECVVPAVKGDSLAKARRLLRRAHCALGTVRRTRRRKSAALVVVSQQVGAGKRRARNTKIAVRLGTRTGGAGRR
ncbi:MAG: hypothetical protein ACYCU0_04160 [Solirubrobacteraceae bacterium]